jgi:hypothetical protein
MEFSHRPCASPMSAATPPQPCLLPLKTRSCICCRCASPPTSIFIRMLSQPRHPNHNPLQLTSPLTRCSSTGAFRTLGPALSSSQSSGFELLKLARSNQLNKDLEKRRRSVVMHDIFGNSWGRARQVALAAPGCHIFFQASLTPSGGLGERRCGRSEHLRQV